MSPLADKTNHLWAFSIMSGYNLLNTKLKVDARTIRETTGDENGFSSWNQNRCLDFCVRFYLLEVSINTQNLEATVFNVIFI